MDNNEILKKINNIFIDILDDNDIVLTNETTADDIEEWDSLNHIQIVVSIEKEFKIRFASKEIQSWMSINDLVNSVQNKLDK